MSAAAHPALDLPTRADEAWRYADLAALERVWPVAVERIVVAAGTSRSDVVVIEGEGAHVRQLAVTLEAGASYRLTAINAARGYGRIAVTAELAEGARFDLGAAQIALGDATLEVVSEVIHQGRDGQSEQIVRQIAGGTARANCLGRVVVAKGADGTDGSQSIRAMLLDRTATANARPELEIHADDVKCAHGCAVGELDGEGLFYLAARGIAPDAARRLMLQAFLAEALAGANDADPLLDRALAVLA